MVVVVRARVAGEVVARVELLARRAAPDRRLRFRLAVLVVVAGGARGLRRRTDGGRDEENGKRHVRRARPASLRVDA
jgi:hypothetical protein